MIQPLATTWLPGPLVDGERQPATPCPALLTAEEAMRYLRMDEGNANPRNTFEHYRSRGLIRGVKIGRHIRYRVSDLDRFMDEQQQEHPN